MVVVVDEEGYILLTNTALENFTGERADDLRGRPFWEVYVIPGDVLPARAALQAAMTDGRGFASEADWVAAGGALRRVVMQCSVLFGHDRKPTAIACVAVDVTEVHRRSTIDALTGAGNRAALFDALTRHLAEPALGQRCADGPQTSAGCGVLFCDMDEFKAVNDMHGHGVGDDLLIEITRRLQRETRPEDTVTRPGGDEFVVVCPGMNEASLDTFANRVFARLGEPFPAPLGLLHVHPSIGTALAHPGEHPDDVLARADAAMYRIKHRRRPSASTERAPKPPGPV
ncbi:hypothetical protein GCM10011589_47620 [Modestobacter marinus]|nr:hypothetical protein GCM10011589_47620 [Modestobacter marinus]